MRELAIVGAGELGGALAHAVARLDVARWIRLIDGRGDVAHGKALDIAQAAPVEGFATRLAGASDYAYAWSADAVVIADCFGTGQSQVDDTLTILRHMSAACRAPIVCAAAQGASIVERGVAELGLRRERLIGSAPEALASAARALVALAVDGSPANVALSLVGLPPSHIVVAWSAATYSGHALTDFLDEPSRRMLERRIVSAWPPGPLALAAAAAKTVACIDGRVRQTIAAFVAPDRAAAARSRVAALPIRVGVAGLERVHMPALTAGERVALENALLM